MKLNQILEVAGPFGGSHYAPERATGIFKVQQGNKTGLGTEDRRTKDDEQPLQSQANFGDGNRQGEDGIDQGQDDKNFVLQRLVHEELAKRNVKLTNPLRYKIQGIINANHDQYIVSTNMGMWWRPFATMDQITKFVASVADSVASE